MATTFPKRLMYSIHQIYVLIQKHMEKKMTDFKLLTFSQFWVLVCFVDCKDPAEQNASAIAKKMYISEATLSRHLEKLLKNKLIVKKQDKKNKRKFIIEMTPRGKIKFELAKELIEAELEKFFGGIAIKDRDVIIENFDKVLNKLIK